MILKRRKDRSSQGWGLRLLNLRAGPILVWEAKECKSIQTGRWGSGHLGANLGWEVSHRRLRIVFGRMGEGVAEPLALAEHLFRIASGAYRACGNQCVANGNLR